MAANKAKRSIPPAQPERLSLHSEPNSRASELMPVKVHAYRTIAELNAGFDKVLQDLKTLAHISFFNSGNATVAYDQVSLIRAEINQKFTMAVHDREAANVAYFGRIATNNYTRA